MADLGSAFATAMNSILDAFGSTAAVTLRGGETFNVRAAPGRRRNDELTKGTDQTEKVIVIDKTDWDNKATRPPNKGDKLVFLGQTLAITAPDIKGVDDVEIVYKCGAKG